MSERRPTPPQPKQQQDTIPGRTGPMSPRPDHGEESYKGHGRLAGKRAIITGGDSGIGRAVAIAFAREGADVCISYLNEHEDAKDTAGWVEKAGRKALLVPGELADRAYCRDLVGRAVAGLGGIDILVNNAAHQRTFGKIEDLSDDEWDYTFDVNIGAMFRVTKHAVKHMKPGASIINTGSIQGDNPTPMLLAYATTKAAIQNFTANLAQWLGEKGIRANTVAPGPIWTPLIPATMPPEKDESFGETTPLKRAGQPAELAAAFALVASDEASYISGATIAVTGGKPIL